MAQTRVVHRQQEAFDFEGRVQLGLDDFNGIQQFADAFQCKIFRLYGDDYRIGGSQCVDRNQTQRRGTVYQDIIKLILQRSEYFFQYLFAVFQIEHLYFGTYQIDVGGDYLQCVYLRVMKGFAYVCTVNNALVDSTFRLLDVHTQS